MLMSANGWLRTSIGLWALDQDPNPVLELPFALTVDGLRNIGRRLDALSARNHFAE